MQKNPGLIILKRAFDGVEEETGLKLNLKILPPLRAHEKFKENSVDSIFPAFEEEMIGDYDHSVCLAKKRDFYFYLRPFPPDRVMRQKSYKIGIVRGYYHPSKTLRKFGPNTVKVDNTSAGMKMLSTGRIGLFLVDNISAVTSLLKEDHPEITFDPKSPVDESCGYFWTRKTKKGLRFLRSLNKHIEVQKLERVFAKEFDDKVRELQRKRSSL